MLILPLNPPVKKDVIVPYENPWPLVSSVSTLKAFVDFWRRFDQTMVISFAQFNGFIQVRK